MSCEYCKEYKGYPTVNSFLYTKKFAFCHHCNTTYNLNKTLPNKKEDGLMARLTSRNDKGDLMLLGKQVYAGDFYEAVSALEEYEDAEEQSRLVVLPMQTGTPLFEVRKIFGEPSLITKAFDKSVSLWEMERLAKELGKTVFLTREEAEAAIATSVAQS